VKVSIVTPSYNHARWLGETIESVVAQDYPDIEYIVVDGESTDGSVDVIRSYEGRIAWWTSEQDSGQAAALNRGLAHATGDLLTWINSDDTLLPGAVTRFVDEFRRDPQLVLAYGDAVYTDDESNRTGPLVARPWDVPRMLRTFECHVVQPASMFSRVAWEAAGPLREDLSWFFDYDFFMKLADIGSVKQLDLPPLATYRLHPESKSVGSPRRRAESLERLAVELPRQPNVPRELERSTRSGGYLAAGEDYYAALDLGAARRCLWKGLALYPPNATRRKVALALKSLLPRPVVARLRGVRNP
jgi:glycosyltransferase involved in cell wall biosynthesis